MDRRKAGRSEADESESTEVKGENGKGDLTVSLGTGKLALFGCISMLCPACTKARVKRASGDGVFQSSFEELDDESPRIETVQRDVQEAHGLGKYRTHSDLGFKSTNGQATVMPDTRARCRFQTAVMGAVPA